MIIDCVADLHGHYPKLEGGDLLIVAGDCIARDQTKDWVEFFEWLVNQKYQRKVLIGGNHDNFLQSCASKEVCEELGVHEDCDWEYLCDSGTEFEGLKIWGSPWTKRFEGMNPNCMAFTVDTDEELAEKWALIPEDTDILVTHCPPHTILDGKDDCVGKWGNYGSKFGSPSLYNLLYQERIRPILHVFGHIHEGYGHIPKMLDMPRTQFVNGSHVNEKYEPVNNPIRILL